jgi:hypothetical protein
MLTGFKFDCFHLYLNLEAKVHFLTQTKKGIDFIQFPFDRLFR